MAEWKRKTFVTKGADPTQVVKWIKGDLEITEFQDIYLVTKITTDDENSMTDRLTKELHQALEREYDREMDVDSDGIDADAGIYGGE